MGRVRADLRLRLLEEGKKGVEKPSSREGDLRKLEELLTTLKKIVNEMEAILRNAG